MQSISETYQKRPKLFAGIIALVVVLTGIGIWWLTSKQNDDGLPPPESVADTGALRISLLPTSECLPFYVADAAGIYDSLRLRVNINDTRAQFDADTALYRQSAHVAYTDLVRLQYQSTKHHRASIIMGLQGAWGLVESPTRRGGNIKALKDHLLGVSRYSCSDLYATAALATSDLAYDDMLRAQVGDFSVRMNMVLQGQIEAAVLPEPFLTYATAGGAKTLWRVPAAEAFMGCLAAKPEVLTSRRRSAQVALLLQGYNAAVRRINKMGLQGCDTLLSRRLHIPIEQLQKVKLPRYTLAAMPQPAALTKSRSFLAERSISLSASILMDDRFVKNEEEKQ